MKTLHTIEPFEVTFEQLFDRLLGNAPARSHAPSAHTLPVDILERDNNLIIRAAVPGVQPEELEITIEKNSLHLKGEFRKDEESDETKVYRRERIYGSFQRSIRLPEGIQTDKVQASFKHGVVEITLPKAEIEQPTVIRVPVTID